MAGTSKSYLRESPGSWTTTDVVKTITHPMSSTLTITVTTQLVEQFTYNPGTATNDVSGACTANTGNPEYFSQTSNDGGTPGGGPEKGFGGVQVLDGSTVAKSHYSP